VAQFKFTVLLMPTSSHKITGISIDPEHYQSDHKIEDEEIKKLLATSANPGKNKKKSKGSGDSKVKAEKAAAKLSPDAANGETQC